MIVFRMAVYHILSSKSKVLTRNLSGLLTEERLGLSMSLVHQKTLHEALLSLGDELSSILSVS